jgi:hypothetical protein
VSTLPSGKTERGAYGLAGTVPPGAKFSPGAVTSYPIPLSFEPKINVITSAQVPTPNCTGSVANPTAAAGYLCVYESREEFALSVVFAPDATHGFLPFIKAPEATDYVDDGSWAVTAP